MLPSQKQQLISLIENTCAGLGLAGVAIVLERPKVEAHGDIATNVALQIAKTQKRNPRDVAAEIANAMRASPEFSSLLDSVEIAGPGFINLRLAAGARQQVVREVLDQAEHFGVSDAYAGKRVMVEFVSANPTGPLHLGHARQAALGDVLANLLTAQGWHVTREFYYNDAGVQIATLAHSVQARARELQGQAITFPETGYRGEYIAEIARDYLAGVTIERDGVAVTADGDVNDLAAIERFSVAYLRNEQDRDLADLGVHFDSFFLESSLYRDRKVEAAVAAMTASGMTYVHDGALWLKTTALGTQGELAGHGGPAADDKDRVMRKSDGTYTYFVPDVAYHLTKLQRGYDKVINVQGTDHFGTIARVRAGLQAAGPALGITVPRGYPDYVLHKMLRVTKGTEEVKMSKRAGTYVALRDLLDWVGRDATRFFLVSRKADAEFVFDVDLAVSKSEENPVYYVQYAHARVCSVFAQAEEKGFAVPAAGVDLAPLLSAREQTLINRLADFPTALADAARDEAPHQMASYLKELAADFHAYYNAERVLVDDDDTRNARLALLLATRQVLSNGLGLLGVSAPQRM